MKRHFRNIEERLRAILIEPLQKTDQQRTEPLDVWSEVQKQVRAQITLNIAGVPIFPNRHLHVTIGATSESEKGRLEASINSAELRTAIAAFLTEEGCRTPDGFWVSLEFVPRIDELPALTIRFDNETSGDQAPERSASLRVLSGQANTPELKFSARRINIGRCARLKDDQGHGVRHNDLAFSEISNGVNETVSRRHAHLEFDENSGRYRLFRDSPSADTSVTSQGSTTANVPLSGSGVALRSGDIIRLGKAEIEFLC